MILFDMLNQRFGTRGFSASSMAHDLELLESADYVYLYILTLDGKLLPVHGLPGPEGEPESSGVPWTHDAKQVIDRAMQAAQEADLLLAIGTSLNVYPVANAVPLAKSFGAKVIILNAEPTPMDRVADAVLRGNIGEVIPRLVEGRVC